jgi:hypothetical protein
MCAIVGIFLGAHAADPRRLVAIRPMAAMLHHRGPDAEEFWSDSKAGFVADRGMHFRQVLGIQRRHWKFVLAVTVTALVGAVAFLAAA